MAGRGAYLHEQRQCWEIGMQNALARALKTDLSTEDKKRLAEFIATLPEDWAVYNELKWLTLRDFLAKNLASEYHKLR